MRKVSWLHLGVTLVVLMVMLLPQASGSAAAGRATAPSTPISVALSVTASSGKGGTAVVSCVVSSTINVKSVSVKMSASGGASFLSAQAWTSAIAKGSPSTFSATVALNKEGNNSVTCTALGPNNNGTRWGDMKTYYFNVGSSSITEGWGKAVLGGKAQLLSPDSPELAAIQPASEQSAVHPEAGAPGAPAPVAATQGSEATTCYSGYWYFYDRGTYLPPADPALAASRAKFALRPLQYSTVYLYDYDYGVSADDYLGAAITDENGRWSLCVTNPQADGDFIDLYFSAYMSNSWWVVSLGAHGTGGTFYWYSPATGYPNTSGAAKNVGAWYVPYTTTNYMAAWLHNDLNRAIFYFTNPRRSSQGAEQGYTFVAYPAWIKWSPSSVDGTYYSFGDDTIHLAGNDPRTYSASTHEYGHRVMNILYPADDWPNGFGNCPSPHFYNSFSGQSCAWSEGWADAVALLVPNDATYRWSNGATANNETRALFGAGDGVEGNVAATFWDWMDINNETDGTYFDQVQMPVDSFLRAIDVQDDERFLEYWAYWKAQNAGYYCAPILNALRRNVGTVGYAC